MAELTPEELITIESYDANAAEWAGAHMTPGFWREDMHEFNRWLPGGRLLEIGSGGGRDARELIRLGYKYTGTDVSAGLIEQAKKNNPEAYFEQVSVYDLDFDKPFNGFWCAAVLLHIPRPRIDEALQSIKRNIVPRGIGYIALKEGEGEAMTVSPPQEGGERFFTFWQNDDFKKILDDNDYEIIRENRRPLSESTTWLSYIVRNN